MIMELDTEYREGQPERDQLAWCKNEVAIWNELGDVELHYAYHKYCDKYNLIPLDAQ